ncbi:hypothetical protein ACFX1Q_010014 [Malus domestica]
MIYLLWNYHGLRSDTVVRAFRGLTKKYRPSVVFLSETKMNCHRIDGVRRRMRYSQRYNVPPIGVAGRLSLWWHETMEVRVEFATTNIIHLTIRESGNGMVEGILGVRKPI